MINSLWNYARWDAVTRIFWQITTKIYNTKHKTITNWQGLIFEIYVFMSSTDIYISVFKSKQDFKIHINIDINIVSVKFIVYSFFKDGHCVGSCISHLPYTCVDKDIITININGFYLFSRKHFHMCVYISKVSVPDDIFSIITSKWKLIHCYINTCIYIYVENKNIAFLGINIITSLYSPYAKCNPNRNYCTTIEY